MTYRIVTSRIVRRRLLSTLGRGLAILPLVGGAGCSPDQVVGRDQSAAGTGARASGGGSTTLARGGMAGTLLSQAGGTTTDTSAGGTPVSNTGGASGAPVSNTGGASGAPVSNTGGASGAPVSNTGGASGAPVSNTGGTGLVGGTGGNTALAGSGNTAGAVGATSCQLMVGALSGAVRGEACVPGFRGCNSGDMFSVCGAMVGEECWCSSEGRVTCGNSVCMPEGWTTATPSAVVPKFKQIRVAGSTACGLLLDGTVRCWGDGRYGVMGSELQNYELPWSVPIPNVIGATSIAVTSSVACALLDTKKVNCWGAGAKPELVAALENVVAIASDDQLICAMTNVGNIHCWGSDGSNRDLDPTAVVATLPDTVMLTAGCALQRNGTVRCWGSNDWGELGDGTTEYRATPVQVQGVTSAVAIHGKGFALLADGTTASWGTRWQASSAIPASLTGITSVVRDYNHGCAILTDGTLHCWGDNTFGQLGSGTFLAQNGPVTVRGLSQVVAIELQSYVTCALVADGTAYCWGQNVAGVLGNGFTQRRDHDSAVTSSVPMTVLSAPSL